MLRKADLLLIFSVRLSQDPSEVEDLRQSLSHSGGVSHHCSAGEGGDGAAVVLYFHYDQNHLHQL